MGRYTPTNIVGASTHVTSNVAGPLTSRVQLQCGAYTDFPNFIPSDTSGLSLQYHATNNAAAADTFTIEPGVLFGDFANETLLSSIIPSVTNPVPAGTNVLFHFPFDNGLNTYNGGNGTYVTSFQATGTLATLNIDIDCWLQNLGGAGFLQIAPQNLTAVPGPGYNSVSYSYNTAGLAHGAIDQPAGQLHNLYSSPSNAGPWSLVRAGLPAGPYTYADMLTQGSTFYMITSVDPLTGESKGSTITNAAVKALPVSGGGSKSYPLLRVLGLI
jgi:hypothetical protein